VNEIPVSELIPLCSVALPLFTSVSALSEYLPQSFSITGNEELRGKIFCSRIE